MTEDIKRKSHNDAQFLIFVWKVYLEKKEKHRQDDKKKIKKENQFSAILPFQN